MSNLTFFALFFCAGALTTGCLYRVAETGQVPPVATKSWDTEKGCGFLHVPPKKTSDVPQVPTGIYIVRKWT